MNASPRRAAARAESAAHSTTAKRLARAGYAAKGILYATIGVLALDLAFGGGGKTTGTRGAIHEIAKAPFGQVLLWIVAVGILGLALWRFAQSLFDIEGMGTGAKETVKRIGLGVSGLIYTSLLVATVQLLLGAGSGGAGSGGENPQGWTARLLSMPFGQVLVAAVGLAVLGYGIMEAVNGFRRKYRRKLDLEGLAERNAHWVERVASFGLVARGTVFGLMGGFFLYAALTADPQRARGLGQTLATIAAQPFGTLLLVVVALGLVAYAAYSFVEARYRRLPAH